MDELSHNRIFLQCNCVVWICGNHSSTYVHNTRSATAETSGNTAPYVLQQNNIIILHYTTDRKQ